MRAYPGMVLDRTVGLKVSTRLLHRHQSNPIHAIRGRCYLRTAEYPGIATAANSAWIIRVNRKIGH